MSAFVFQDHLSRGPRMSCFFFVLRKDNRIKLTWVPGNSDVIGNKIVDMLTKYESSNRQLVGPALSTEVITMLTRKVN